jgi:phosphoserine phosphatase RsbU/P
VVRLVDAAKQDGLRAGDRVVEIEGGVPRGRKDVQQPIREKQPGETLAVSVTRDSVVSHHNVRLFAYTPENALTDAITLLLVPWFSIALGFRVAALRPRDPRAWMMLGILMGMGQFEYLPALDPLGWPAVVGATAVAYRSFAQSAWAICMMLLLRQRAAERNHRARDGGGGHVRPGAPQHEDMTLVIARSISSATA